MEIKEVIKRIGFFRNRLHLSARELSLRIGKHEGYINKLESKDFNLPTTMLLKIIEALQVSPQEFFADNYGSMRSDDELYSLIRDLPLKKKELIIDLIKQK